MALEDKIKQIEELVEKYYDAETSSQEEEILREFFTNEEVPAHLMYEKAQFAYYKEQSEIYNDIEFEIPKKKTSQKKNNKIFNLMNYAAAAVVLVSAGWFSNNKYQEHLQEQHEIKIAYDETQKALAFLSSNFNVGIEKAEKFSEMNKSQQYIIEKQY
ncbi:MAG: hypothetical protein KAH10_08880 [Flavobacteriales bacterium]|nr:hypothetical protein [Flavobacteriales bacterium]